MEQSTTNPRHAETSRYMAADDWNLHREQITRLYREEDRTLKQTMEIVEAEHGLKAT